MSGFPAHIASFFVSCLFILAGSASAAPAGAADGFLLLPGGEFQMGSPDSERLREADEVLHTVRISPFFVDPYEVTQEDCHGQQSKCPQRKTPASGKRDLA